MNDYPVTCPRGREAVFGPTPGTAPVTTVRTP
jgi:hypothetical protein